MVPTLTCGFLRSNVPLAMECETLLGLDVIDLYIYVAEVARR